MKAQAGPRGSQGHAVGMLMSELWLELMAPTPMSDGFRAARENRNPFLAMHSQGGRYTNSCTGHIHTLRGVHVTRNHAQIGF